ncbi:hypothetical protein EES40_31305 [Streptomyces sp. ADI93-02]|nr:hypothetical protein EES40_31305 [Streptomyces sp. ADI93-02]
MCNRPVPGSRGSVEPHPGRLCHASGGRTHRRRAGCIGATAALRPDHCLLLPRRCPGFRDAGRRRSRLPAPRCTGPPRLRWSRRRPSSGERASCTAARWVRGRWQRGRRWWRRRSMPHGCDDVPRCAFPDKGSGAGQREVVEDERAFDAAPAVHGVRPREPLRIIAPICPLRRPVGTGRSGWMFSRSVRPSESCSGEGPFVGTPIAYGRGGGSAVAFVVATGFLAVAADGHRAPAGTVGAAAVEQEQPALVVGAGA